MSETETIEKAPEPAAEAPKAPAEKPFNTDIFASCTSRVSRRAWDVFLEYRPDENALKTKPLRGKLIAATPDAAQEIHKILVEQGGVTEITTNGKEIQFTASIATIQLVIKHPKTCEYDGVKA